MILILVSRLSIDSSSLDHGNEIIFAVSSPNKLCQDLRSFPARIVFLFIFFVFSLR